MDKPAIPSFDEAKNRRQRVRAAGMNPHYWYPAEYDEHVKPGSSVEVKFWGESILVYRGVDGVLHAMANRCAHRQVKLSLGEVQGCNVVCPYHGWSYDGCGRLVDIPHERFGRPLPKIQLRSYPVRVRYGLIWIFPGDPARADITPMPEIPELEGPERWACVPIDFTWRAHHSMIIDNVSDFTHEFLHRRYKPFADAKLTRYETQDDRVFVEYDTKVAGGPLYKLFLDRERVNTNHMTLCYEYPYQWSNTDDWIRHWCFVLPIDQRTTRAFFLFYYYHKVVKLPLLPLRMPRQLMTPLLRAMNVFVMAPLLREDGFAVEAEQEGYEDNFRAPVAELNPAVTMFQDLTVRKWEEHLAEQKAAAI